MNHIDSAKLRSLMDTLMDLEVEKETIRDQHNDAVQDFLDNNGLDKNDKKLINEAFRAYKKYCKDAAEFHETQAGIETLLQKLTEAA
jgi:uncharacterized protein (UPF0335 family)